MIDRLKYIFIYFTTKSLKFYEYGKMKIKYQSQKEIFKHFFFKKIELRENQLNSKS